ncbi:asparagine synthase (glutamine-hydrolyzing) [Nonomuraea sp. NPDC049309]|uniref:asparagine synthase (glutamine-hydrolyzing) n=1 Tax=Nonomuraea sp. NPDC049309 TaxID=3364350 RepID=UPI003716B790
MCGIAGWVDYAAGPTEREGVLRAMTDTMACRGPDAGGTWSCAQAALGHRRLAVIDPEGGAQPMTALQDGRVAAVLSYSGEVYNFAELRSELAGLGAKFRTRSDTEVVLRAYLAWGERFAARLEGMYAFALWDARRRALLLVRDRLGVKPLYYARTPGGVLFGSEPKAILAHPGFECAVDVDGLRELFTLVRTPGAAVWRGMDEVRPGTVVTVDERGCRTSAYWRPAAEPYEGDAASAASTLRDLLEGVVERQLVSDVPLGVLLSGGLDSSAVAALAARRSPTRIRSFSVEFAGHERDFRPDDERPDLDAPYAARVAEHAGTAHLRVVVDSAQLIEPGLRTAVLRAYDRPPLQSDMSTSLYLLFRAVRRHSTVALSGEAADEIFGGYGWFHEREAVHAGTFPWVAGAVRFPRFSILRPEVDRLLDTDEHLRQSYRDALAEVPALPGEDAEERRMREVTYLHLTRYLPPLLERKDRMSMAVGLEVRVPYCDHRLVEFAYNVPWKLKNPGGGEKGLLRAAVADILPPAVLSRRKSNYPTTRDKRYTELIRNEYLDLMGRPESPVFDLADRRKLTWLARDAGGTASELFTRRAREQVLALDQWLSLYRPRLML